jgi:hypothetical protein
MPRVSKREQAEAVERLREWVRPGDTVYCVLRRVSKSGMTRVIDLKALDTSDERRPVTHIGYNAAKALGLPYDDRRQGIKIGGAGMDMGFALVYDLGWKLFGEGWTCTGPGCPSNDHTNGDRNYEPHPHRDGGYALRHEWL